MATDYGTGFSCTNDLDPLMRLVSGDELMAQVCLHRLFCRQGYLLTNPVDNTLDLRDMVGRGISASDLPSIEGQCASALIGDERIFSAVVVATFNAQTNRLTLNITGNGSGGPFDLTLVVSAVTVELLRQ